MDYSILLQGRIEPKAMEFWVTNYHTKNIYVSIWDDDIEYAFPKTWVIIKNKKPKERITSNNLDLQILSTLAGLEKINTKFVLKLRCDEYWSNLDIVFDKIESNPDKIICGSMFFRKIGMFPFSISDHIMGGRTENMKLLFESTLKNLTEKLWDYWVPESQLGLGYLLAKEPTIKNEVGNFNLFNSYHPDPTPFNTNECAQKVTKEMKNIELFSERIKNELLFPKINWKNIKKWRQLIEYSVFDIKRNLEKSEYPNIDEYYYINKWFDIVDVNELKPYLATCIVNSGERVWMESNWDGENCISKL